MPSTKRNAVLPPPSSTRTSSRARTKRDFLNPSNTTTQLHDNQKESAVAGQDPLERKGREFWASSNSRSSRFLGKFADKLADWGFYPLTHGSCKDVKKRGIQGVHYGRGYYELGSMVEKYTTDIAQWPKLPSHTFEGHNQEFSSVQMSVQSPLFQVSYNSGQAVVSPSTNDESGENTNDVEKQQLSLLARVQYLETRAYGEEKSFRLVERLRSLEKDFLENDSFDDAKEKTFNDRLHQLENILWEINRDQQDGVTL